MNSIYKSIFITLTLFIVFSVDLFSADRYFKSGATLWNSASSWSSTSPAGVDSAGVPTTADIAIFASSSGSCSINATVSCAGISIQAGYLGVITQGAFAVTVGSSAFNQAGGSFVGSASAKTINGAFTLSGGTFTAGTSAMTVTGVFTLSAGTFTSTTGILTLASTNAISAGVFAPNNGTVTLTAAAVTIVSGNFYNLTLNNSTQILTVTNNLIVNNTLTTSALATINGSPIEARGNLVFSDTSWNGSSKIIVNGTGTQTNTGSGVCGVMLDINKTAGSLNLGANLTLLGAAVDLNLVAGTVNAGAFNMTLPRNLVKTAGVLGAGTGTVFFTGAAVSIVDGNFYNLTLNNAAQILTVTNNLIVNNTLTTTAIATINGSSIEARGSLIFTDTSWNGTSKIIVNGTGTQTNTGSGVCGVMLDINKASGTFNLGANLTLLGAAVDLNLVAGTVNANTFSITLPRNLVKTAGVLNTGTGTVIFSGVTTNIISGNFYNLTLNNSSLVATITNNTIVNNTLTTTALATINGSPIEAKGNLVLSDTSWNGSSKLILNGTGVQTKTGAGVCGVSLDVNKVSGSLDLGANFALLGTTSDLNLIAGTINCSTFTLTVPRNFLQSAGVFNGGTNTNTISGALTVNAGSFNATSGNLAMTNGAITLATGTFNPNGGTITATGSTSRTYTFNNNTLNNLTLAGTTGSTVVTFANAFTIAGKFIYTLATLNLTSGTITITGDLSARGLSTGTASYTFSGTGTQNIDCNGTTGNIGSVTINKTGGALNVSNTPIFIKNFTYLAGSVNWGTAIAKFGRVSTTVSPVITSNGLIYGNVEILTGTADTMTLTGDMIVNGNFNMNVANVINGSKFRLRGNISTVDTAITGTASTIIDGTGNQNIGGAGTLPGNGSNEVVVNKPSGTLNLTSNLSLSNTNQDLRIVDGDLALNGFNLTVRDNFNIFDKLTLKGSETITVNLLTTPAITNPRFTISGTSSTIEYTDSAVVANITKLSKTFNNLNLGAGKTHEVATGAGNGITVNGIFASNGSSANRSVLRSLANASSTWQLNLVGTSALADKVDVKYSDASLGAEVSAISSIDSGNNTNWKFSLLAVTGVTSSTTNGSYKQGNTVSIQVTFNEVAIVTGNPTLTLETGTTDRIATYTSGSNSSTLVFTYTVQVGDVAADLDYTTTTALSLNGGTIKSASNSDAVLTLATPGATGSLGFNKNLVIYTFAATAQGVSLNEDASLSIILSSNYAGINAVTYSIVTPPANGSLVLVSGSTYLYTPSANFNGSNSFVFKANDGADSLPATVNITVNPLNDAPVASNQTITVVYNVANPLTLNNSDVEASPLTYVIGTQPTNGALTVLGYSVSYQPNANYYGSDSFTYHVSDGLLNSAVVTVTLKVDDAQEANDTSGNAKDITTLLNAGGGVLNMPDLMVLPNNEDWFKFTVTERSEIDLWFLFTPGNSVYDLDVYLYNSSLTQIGFGESGTPNEHIVNNDLAIGTYYIQVLGWAGSSNKYEMQLTRTTYSPDDRFEPNDTIETAENLTTDLINADGQLFVGDLNLIANNNDYYQVTLLSTSNLIVSTSFVNANGNLALQIVNSIGTVLGTSNTSTNTESITLNTLASGNYFIRVYGVGAAQNDYSMIVQATAYIDEDAFEPNETKGAAIDISSYIVNGSLQISNLRLNSFNVDWFKFTISETAPTVINVLFTPGNGEYDLDISLENTAGTILAEGLTGQPNETLSLNLSAGTYYLKVYGWSNAHNNYALNMAFDYAGNQPPSAFNQNVAVFENNAIDITLTGQDPESQPLTYSVVTLPAHGTLTGTGSHREYTPTNNYYGPDSFTFTVSDGSATSNTATVSITVLHVNEAPVAVTDILMATTQNNGGVFTSIPALFDVIANDTDPENNPLTITNVTTPPNGVAIIQDNQILYTTNLGYVGPDSFTYTISDGQATASVAVSITVNLLTIDYFPPVVLNATIPSTQTTYTTSEVIDIMLQFDNAVTVTGYPQLALNFNNGVKLATYTHGTGTDQIHFSYTVQSGDYASPLNYVDVTSLALNGGTMTNAYSSSVDADLQLPLTSSPESLLSESVTVDANVPALSIDIPGGNYNNYKIITFTPQNFTGGTLRVYYTTNGATPTTSSPFVDISNQFKLLINSNATLRAFASNGIVASPIITASYTFKPIKIKRISSPIGGLNAPCFNPSIPSDLYNGYDDDEHLTRMFEVTFELSDIEETRPANIAVGGAVLATPSVIKGVVSTVTVNITPYNGATLFESYIADPAPLLNKGFFNLVIDRINTYAESFVFDALVDGQSTCEGAIVDYNLLVTGAATVTSSISDFDKVVSIHSGSSAPDFEVNAYSWYYYQFNGLPSTPLLPEFYFFRFAFDKAGNAKILLNTEFKNQDVDLTMQGFMEWELENGYFVISSHYLDFQGIEHPGPSGQADSCGFISEYDRVRSDLKTQMVNTGETSQILFDWEIYEGTATTTSDAFFFGNACDIEEELSPLIVPGSLISIEFKCDVIKVNFNAYDNYGLPTFNPDSIRLHDFLDRLPDLSTPGVAIFDVLESEYFLHEEITASATQQVSCFMVPEITSKVKIGVIENLEFAKCGINFDYKCNVPITEENYPIYITIEYPDKIDIDLESIKHTYFIAGNSITIQVYKLADSISTSFSIRSGETLYSTDAVTVTVLLPCCNNSRKAEYSDGTCNLRKEKSTPNLTSPKTEALNPECECNTYDPTASLSSGSSKKGAKSNKIMQSAPGSTSTYTPPVCLATTALGTEPIPTKNKPIASMVKDGYNRVISIVYADSSSIDYDYDDINKILYETNEVGAIIKYEYDSTFTNVTKRTSQGSGNGYRYVYYPNGTVEKIITLENNVELYFKSFEYDANKKVTKKTENDGTFETWNYTNNVETHTDKFGNVSVKNYDSEKRFISSVSPSGSVVYTYIGFGSIDTITKYNPESQVIFSQKYIYAADVFARLIGIEYRLTTNLAEAPYYTETYDSNGMVTTTNFLREGVVQTLPGVTYEYNSDGNVITATAPDGGEISYSYSTLPGTEDLVASETNALNHTIYHEYNSMRRETKVYGATTRPGVSTYFDNGTLQSFECKQFNPLTQTFGVTHYKEIYTYSDTLLLTKTVQNAAGTASIVESNTYDFLGRRETHTDANGVVTKYVYNSMDNVTQEIRDYGVGANFLNITTTYTYNAKGQLEDTILEGKRTRNIYDSFGRLQSVVQDPLPLGLNITQVSYTYDSQWRQKTVTDAMGNITTYNYNQLGQQYQTVNALGVVSESVYDGAGNVIRRIEDKGIGKLNATTEFFFDNQGRQFKTVSAVGQTYQREDRVEFDLNSNVVKQIEDFGIGKLNRTTVFEFDDLGNQTKTTLDPDAPSYVGLKITNQSLYNEIGQMITSTAPNGLVTQYNYNYLGRQTSTVVDPTGLAITNSTIYDNAGNVTQTTDAGGLIVTVVYDALSRQGTQTVDPGGKNIVSKTFYNRDNTVDKTINPEGVVSKNIYNSLGQRTSTIVDQGATNITTQFEYNLVGNITTIIDPLTKTATRGYDSLHRSIASTDAKGNISRVIYDNLNRPVTSIDALGVQTVTNYNLLNQVTSQTVDPTGLNQTSSMEYDSLGRTTKVIKASGVQEVFEYDLADRKTKSIDDPTGLNIITNYEFNNLSQMTKVIDAKNKATQYGYNYLGQLTSETYADTGVKSYTYNSIGQRVTQTDQNNNQFGYLYDNLYRLTTVNVIPGLGVGGTTQQVFEYDNLSRLTNAKDITTGNTNEVIRDYNTLGRLETETQKIGTTTEKTIAKQYNLVGRVNQLTYPNGRINSYTFDDNHLPYTTTSNSTVVATYQFNAVNAPVTKTLGNNVSLNIEYNNRYQIKKHDWKLNGNTITGFNYGHDSVGNRLYSENLVTASKSEHFVFDNADRLTSFKTGTLNANKDNIVAPTYSQSWNLDSIGNWAGFTDNGTSSTNIFSDTHEMTQFKGITNTFDNNGNLTSDGVRTFKYDAFNRIIQVKVGVVVLAEYQYDAFNRRVMKKVDADLNSSFELTIKFLYDGFRCIEELDASNALTKEYVYGSLYIDEVILQKAGLNEYYFTHDYRYSVTSLTNLIGNTVANYEYKVYGERTSSVNGLTDVGYTGQRHDSETGMMYFKNRYYSTSMGSFVTRDPLGYVDGLSMYLGYFGGMNVDPLGLEIKILQADNLNEKDKEAVETFVKSVNELINSLKDMKKTYLKNKSVASIKLKLTINGVETDEKGIDALIKEITPKVETLSDKNDKAIEEFKNAITNAGEGDSVYFVGHTYFDEARPGKIDGIRIGGVDVPVTELAKKIGEFKNVGDKKTNTLIISSCAVFKHEANKLLENTKAKSVLYSNSSNQQDGFTFLPWEIKADKPGEYVLKYEYQRVMKFLEVPEK